MSTVLLLGAGASAASDHKLPTMAGFFGPLNDRQETCRNLNRFIRERFGEGVKWDDLNLEVVVTHLYLMEREFLSLDLRTRTNLALARQELDYYVFWRFTKREVPKSQEDSDIVPRFSCEKHSKLFNSISLDSDSILTLNYDLVVEGTLYPQCLDKDRKELDHNSILSRGYYLLQYVRTWGGERPTLRRPDVSKGYFIKLHGSVDWFYCPNTACSYHSVFFQNSPGSPSVHALLGDMCFLCGRQLVLAMIPPALGKTFDEFPKMSALWSLAYRKLREAQKWVVVGVSLTESDYYLRAMLREARAANRNDLELHVINICADHRQRMIDLARPKTTKQYESLDEYLRAIERPVTS